MIYDNFDIVESYFISEGYPNPNFLSDLYMRNKTIGGYDIEKVLPFLIMIFRRRDSHCEKMNDNIRSIIPVEIKNGLIDLGVLLDYFSKDKDYRVRAEIAKIIKNPKEFCFDSRKEVRSVVARRSLYLDILANDNTEEVRLEVVKAGHTKQNLIADEHYKIRQELARQGKHLEIFLNDINENVRTEVAKHGFGLAKLVFDTSPKVRQQVALQGYGLEILCKDKNAAVRETIAFKGNMELSLKTDVAHTVRSAEKISKNLEKYIVR